MRQGRNKAKLKMTDKQAQRNQKEDRSKQMHREKDREMKEEINVKLSLCFNRTPRHEDALGE